MKTKNKRIELFSNISIIYFLMVFFGFVAQSFGQNDALQKNILQFEAKLNDPAEKENRLMMLDSLIIWYADDNYNPKIEQTFEIYKKEFLAQKEKPDYFRLIHNGNILTKYYSGILNNPKKGLALSDTVRAWLKFTDKPRVIGNYYLDRGTVFFNFGQNDSVISNQKKAQKYFKNLDRKDDYFLSKNFESQSLVDMGQHAAATIILDSCFAFYEKKKDTSKMFDMLNSKTIVLSKLKLYDESRKNRKKLLKFSQNNALKLSILYINQGTDESNLGNQQATVKNYKLALENAEKTDYVDYLKPIILSGLSQKLFEYGQIEEGKKYFYQIAENYDVNNESFSKYYQDAKAQMFIATKDYKAALKTLKDILPMTYKSKNAEDIKNAEKDIASVYELLNQPQMAIEHYKKHYILKDSLDNIAKLNSLFYYESLYENEKKENVIKEQNFKISDLSQKNKYQKTTIFGLLILGTLIIIAGFLGFKQYQAKKESKLKATFSQDLIVMQEQQRTRLAFELHDGIGQRLTLLKQKLQAANQEETSKLTAQILEETRGISRELYPAVLSQVGISEAIKTMIDDIDETSELFFTHEIEDIDGVFSKDQELNIYRFVQESLGNIIKHSKATEAFINIKKEGSAIKIEIEDNGVGFDVNSKLQYSKSLGIKTMKERINMLKGILNIKSIQGKFTNIQVILNI